MKPIAFKNFLLRAAIILALYGVYLATLNEKDIPILHNGDIVFQTTWNDQTLAIAMASHSSYIHTGIIADNGNGKYTVIEAGKNVTEIPFDTWVQRGTWKRFTIYRYQNLTPEQAGRIVATARFNMGISYDYYFSAGKEALYCSELVYLAFNESGIELGGMQKIGDLSINNRYAKSIIEQRWKNYPACKTQDDISFEQCYARIIQGNIITPRSIADDPHLKKIFSNYP